MEAQDNGNGSPDKDVYYDEDGDDSDTVGWDRMKEFWLRRKFERCKVARRHDNYDDVKTLRYSEEVITDRDDLSLEQQWP